MKDKKNNSKAAQWGSQGGKIGGPKRAQNLSAAERTKIARQGGKARQKKTKGNG